MILQKWQKITPTGIFSHISVWGLAQKHLILIEWITIQYTQGINDIPSPILIGLHLQNFSELYDRPFFQSSGTISVCSASVHTFVKN